MMVEMGAGPRPPRLLAVHGPAPPRYEPGNPFETRSSDYYRYLDQQIGKLLERARPTTPHVMVVSDHGASA